MAYPSPTTVRSVAGSAKPAYLTTTLSSSYVETTFTVNSAATWKEVGANGQNTNNPLGTSGPFTVFVNFGNSVEEHILCSAVNTSTGVVTIWTDGTLNGRGWDGTPISSHSAGSSSNYDTFPAIGGTDFAAITALAQSFANSSVATVALTNQSAAISATSLYTPTSSGFYQINYYGKVTTASSAISTLGAFQITSTDPDGNSVTSVGDSTSQNSLTGGFISGTIDVYANAGTPIQYAMSYYSAGDTAMVYSLYISVISLNTASVQAYVQNSAGKNAILNGAFDFWQRGTSFTSGTNAQYLADRWCGWGGWGSSTSYSVSRQSTGLTNLPIAARIQRIAGQTNTTNPLFGQSLESANSIPFAGQTVTLSFYARAGSNFSASGNALGVNLISSTGTDQNIATSYSPQYNAIGQTPTLTTSWQRFTYTGTFTTNTTEFAVQFNYLPTGTAGTNDYFDITGVQVELGGAATVFSRAGGTYGGELALCQRYAYQMPQSTVGFAVSSSVITFFVPHPQIMRTTPTATFLNTSVNVDNGLTNFTSSGSTMNGSSAYTTGGSRVFMTGFTGLTTGGYWGLATYPAVLFTAEI